MKRKYLRILGLIVALMVAGTRPAMAYLDPGSGSYLIQIIIAGVIALGATMTTTGEKLKSVLKKILKKDAKKG